MTVKRARAAHADVVRAFIAHRSWCWWTDADFDCPACSWLDRLATLASLVADNAVAERIHGRGTPTATRLAAHEMAQREGIAW